MPAPQKDIVSFLIKIDGMGFYEIIAGNQPQASPVGGWARSGMDGPNESAFLKEVLQKIIAAYPGKPVTLCVDGATIYPDATCTAAAAAAARSGN
jgi:hypothetical protein